ncbi:MAG: D-isomer specific 2-hydroxyacid dehydrogenase family protein [Gemmiger sp.]|nr:D-isomer specific 2-hydroxyacid dehydrogenase family protein [Gemmiger sp.]
MKIMFYALRPFDELAYCHQYSKEYGIEFATTPEYPSPENAHLAAGCDAICMTPCDMGAAMVDRFADLGVKYLICRSIGYDHVDLRQAKARGMRVANVGYSPNGVANYAIMLMLMCTRRMPHIMARAALQDYSLKGKMGRDLSSCTVGVIGTGRIGQTVLRHLSGFGCKCLAYDITQNEAAAALAEYQPLDALFAKSDIITLHTNATAQNHHLIDKAALAKMKDGVILINTARGTLIDSDALIDALDAGKVGAAGLDVIENENGLYYYNHGGEALPNRELAILRAYPNVIVSPHTAFYTDEDVASMVEGAFTAVEHFATGTKTWQEVGIQ